MSNDILLQDAVSCSSALGVDLLHNDAPVLGLGTNLDVAIDNGGRAEAVAVPAGGLHQAVGAAVRTGRADDATVLLAGCAGVDTATDAAVIPSMGGNMLIAWTAPAANRTLGRSDDMGVANDRHCIAVVATRVTLASALQTGRAQ